MKHSSKKMGFTLIELLVVIAIIAILAAILFPVFAQARIAAKKTSTVSAMKQQAIAVTLYADDNGDILPPRFQLDFPAAAGQKVFTWERLCQPYAKNFTIFNSSEDPRPKYQTPFAGSYRRSFAGAANMFIGVQSTTGTAVSKSSRSPSSVAQPSDTVLIGMKFMNHRTLANYWDTIEWTNESIMYNTRNAQLPTSDPRSAYGEVQNVYGGTSVWAFADTHVKAIRANGFATALQTGMTNVVPHGTRFPGYEERAGSWVNSVSPAWDRGISCLEAEVNPASPNRDCPLPGE